MKAQAPGRLIAAMPVAANEEITAPSRLVRGNPLRCSLPACAQWTHLLAWIKSSNKFQFVERLPWIHYLITWKRFLATMSLIVSYV